jgi:hypothetical protein
MITIHVDGDITAIEAVHVSVRVKCFNPSVHAIRNELGHTITSLSHALLEVQLCKIAALPESLKELTKVLNDAQALALEVERSEMYK